MKNNITFISSSRDTKEYFNALSKQAEAYSKNKADVSLYGVGFKLDEIRIKEKVYSTPIDFNERGSYSKTYYKNVEYCFNYLKGFCDMFNLSFKDFKTMPKTRDNQDYRMAFAWCANRKGFDKFVISEVIYKHKKTIDYYMNKMNHYRYTDNLTKQTCEAFQIANKYEKV